MITNIWHYQQLNKDQQKIGQLIKNINDLIVNFNNINGSVPTNSPDANLIMENIWLGNSSVAQDFNFMVSKKINTIINITKDISNYFDFIDYVNYFIRDDDACQINLFYVMEQGAKIINDVVSNKKTILVHCKRGHHRSACVVAFYLMKYHNISLICAISLIKNIRPTAFRRITCMLQELILYEIKRN